MSRGLLYARLQQHNKLYRWSDWFCDQPEPSPVGPAPTSPISLVTLGEPPRSVTVRRRRPRPSLPPSPTLSPSRLADEEDVKCDEDEGGDGDDGEENVWCEQLSAVAVTVSEDEDEENVWCEEATMPPVKEAKAKVVQNKDADEDEDEDGDEEDGDEEGDNEGDDGSAEEEDDEQEEEEESVGRPWSMAALLDLEAEVNHARARARTHAHTHATRRGPRPLLKPNFSLTLTFNSILCTSVGE